MSVEVRKLQHEIKVLKETLRLKESQLHHQLRLIEESPYCPDFSTSEITRYSRQIIMPQIGLNGQLSLKQAKILIVGAGGLGCPASLYLAAAGVGNITLIDYDEVDLTNLHRQILHGENDIGMPKVNSAFNTLRSINSNIKIVPLKLHGNSSTMSDLVNENQYNLMLDCTDNVATRYLLNDISVINQIPLVSGSALRFEGQLTVYNYENGPCYRCLFPKPPPPETVTNCGDGGVLGVIPGTIGILQALEAIKILIGLPGVLSQRLLLFDGTDTTFRTVKLRQKSPKCDVCGDSPTITSPIDYEEFCGAQAHDNVIDLDLLENDEHICASELKQLLGNEFVIDVRPELEFAMCKLPGTVNIPYSDLIRNTRINEVFDFVKHGEKTKVYVLCRRGNDSQRSIKYLKEQFKNHPVRFLNVRGGLHAFNEQVDASFPLY